MQLTPIGLAKMIDVSCVRTTSSRSDIDEMIAAARKYGIGQISVLQSFLPYVQEKLLEASGIRVIGNVGFPSGSESTSVKVYQAQEMVAAGCDELDMVMNIGKLRSGLLQEVEEDVKAVIAAAGDLPVKVIIEVMLLTQTELEQACRICIHAGAMYVKSGSGWAHRGTTVQDILRIKAVVGDAILIKASGGIRDLSGLVEMYRAGARRFGINLHSAVSIIENCRNLEPGEELQI